MLAPLTAMVPLALTAAVSVEVCVASLSLMVVLDVAWLFPSTWLFTAAVGAADADAPAVAEGDFPPTTTADPLTMLTLLAFSVSERDASSFRELAVAVFSTCTLGDESTADVATPVPPAPATTAKFEPLLWLVSVMLLVDDTLWPVALVVIAAVGADCALELALAEGLSVVACDVDLILPVSPAETVVELLGQSPHPAVFEFADTLGAVAIVDPATSTLLPSLVLVRVAAV